AILIPHQAGSRGVEGRMQDPHEIAADDIRRQLAKILASGAFRGAGRSSRFLNFIVEHTLQGRGETLKEYFIGVEVLGRRESFDPRLDSIVRTEASRLRARLKSYYESEGSGDSIFIELPKGGYVPIFTYRTSPAEPLPDGPAPGEAPIRSRAGEARFALSQIILAVLIALAAALAVVVWRSLR
ncbi:MAG: hypothetical protein ACRD7E_14960, partial [Bryobacteraceae bacterium]